MKQLLLKGLAACMLLLLAGKIYSAPESEPNNTQLTSDIATLNSSNTGTAGYSYDYDWWEITIPENGNLTINSVPSTTKHLWCYLYDNDGTTLLASGYDNSSFNISRNDLAAGTYYIKINCYYFGDSTDYTFTPTFTAPTVTPDNEPNDYYPIANTLAVNDSTTGNIGYYYNLDRDSSDWYQITTLEDGPLYIYLEPLYTQFAWIYLYDNDGTTLLASGYDNAAFSINRQDLAAGIYHVLIKPYYSNGYTPYKLKNQSIPLALDNDDENNDVVANAVTISENSTIEGHIGYYTEGARDPDDWYEITTTEDGILNFSITQSLVQHTWMYIYDTDGITILASGYDNTPFSVSRNDLAAGTYYLRVRMYYTYGYNSYSISNTITPPALENDSEPNDVVETAVTISPNSTLEGHIGYYTNGARDADDWYEITTTEDGILNFALTGALVQHTYMYIYDTDGITVLSSDYSNGPFSISRNDLAAGTYYLRVRMYFASGYNSYSITNTLTPPLQANDPEPNNSIPTATPLETNVTVDGHLGYYNSGVRDVNDYYALTLSSPGDVTFTVDAINNVYIYCRLYSADGVTFLGGNYALGGYTFTKPDLAAGTYIVKVNNYYSSDYTPYTFSNSFCPDAITIVAEGETTFCDGESVTLSTEDHHLSYLWSDASTTETNTVTLTGDYYLTIDNGGGCIRTSNTISTESTPLPVAVIEADGPTEFCDGGDVTLSVPITPDTYLWSTGETTPTITVSATGDYDVLLSKNGCTAISDPIHITVNPNPVATITPDGSTEFCEGGSVELIATTADTYLWSNGETTSSIIADASGDYSVTITDANGCSDMSAVTSVTENANPVAGISADGATTFCSGESVNLIGSGGATYLWSNGETTSSINVTSSGDYSVTVYSAEGCSAISDIISVTVEACGTVTISADGPTEFCEGGSVLLTSSELTGNVWSTGETTQSILVTTSGDYYCMNGVNTSDIISVTVNANPDATISADGPTEFCDGGSVNINATAGYDSYLWSNGEITSSINVTMDGSYSVEVTDNGCSATSSTIDVNIDVAPTVSISALTPILCYEGSVDITATTDGTSLQWQLEGVDIEGATNATYSATINGKYTCVASNGTCSTTSNTIKIKYADRVAISPAGTVSLCEPSLMMSVGVYPGSTYQWYQNNEIIVGAVSNTYTTTTVGKFYCLINKDGCTRASKLLLVNPCRLENDANAFNLAPNPASTSFMINYEISTAGQTSFMIADITGRMIWQDTKSLSEGFYSDEFNTEQFAAGMYLVQIVYADGKHIEQQLVIEK